MRYEQIGRKKEVENMKYSNLNDGIDEYLKKYEDTFYVSNLDFAIDLIRTGGKKFNLRNTTNYNAENQCFEEKVSGVETLDLVTSFLAELDGDYLQCFTKSFNEGRFDFYNDLENNDKKIRGICSYEGYTVNFNGTISDSRTIIHEFFHSLNIKNYKLAPIFSEMISIFMENKFLDFLNTKGYSRNDIAKSRLARYNDFSGAWNRLIIQSNFLNLKNKIGYLDEESYDFISMHEKELNFPHLSKEDFIEVLEFLDDRIKNSEKIEQAFNPEYSFRYYIGTIYSSYLLLQEDSLDKVLLLNEYLRKPVEETDIESAFRIIGIKDETDFRFIDATNKYYQKEKLIYQGVKKEKFSDMKNRPRNKKLLKANMECVRNSV